MSVWRFPFGRLSEREDQVFALLARGLDFKAIAARLPIASETARTYFKRGARKLGAKTPIHAMALYKDCIADGSHVPYMGTSPA